MLRREQKIRNVILFTLFSILFIGVGYAVISSNLKMNGSMTLNKITWDVHLENFEELYDNTVHGTNTFSSENTNMTYTVSLNKPGDIYEFTIDVVNAGNIDAMLSALDVSGLTAPQQAVIEYSVKYLDGTTPTVKDALKVGESETFVISLKTKADITNDKLSATDTNLTLNFNPTYAQADKSEISRPTGLYSLIKKDAVLDNISSTYVSATTGIDFSKESSDTNGKGIYILNTTKNDTNPVYYYRGSVDNNNVKFGNYCWKIVRTTKTGGIKLLYNGIPDENGFCQNKTGVSAGIGQQTFNNVDSSIAFLGYMYDKNYRQKKFTNTEDYKYGSTVEYINNKYKLKNTTNVLDNTHHYTCLTNSDECEEVAFIYYLENTDVYYINLNNGEKYNDSLAKMKNNVYDSNVKLFIENWFKDNLLDNKKYIEDTVYCNDRRQKTAGHGWSESGNLTGWMYYEVYRRIAIIKSPSLSCENNDSFTFFENNGNGKLKYPIGLITTDELMYAGNIYFDNTITTDNYTGINDAWLTMSPLYYKGRAAYHMYVKENNKISSSIMGNRFVVRPVLSLKKGTKIASGDGTQNNPYVIS